MTKIIKVAISMICFLAGLFNAPPLFLMLIISLTLLMCANDLWLAIHPVLKSIQRRNEFMRRRLHRSEWPVKRVELPAIKYEHISFEEAIRHNPLFMKGARCENKK